MRMDDVRAPQRTEQTRRRTGAPDGRPAMPTARSVRTRRPPGSRSTRRLAPERDQLAVDLARQGARQLERVALAAAEQAAQRRMASGQRA